jgi:crossover junction endodeoxyribonuclease RuvC
MIILGIDPGLATTGYGIILKKGSSLFLQQYGVISTLPKQPLAKRLSVLSSDLKCIIEKYKPHVVAVEELFFNTNIKTALVVGQARGAILLTAEQHNLAVYNYTPLQVKIAVSGYGKAPKAQVQSMVKRLLNIPKVPKPDDAADALAIAICHSQAYKLKSIL